MSVEGVGDLSEGVEDLLEEEEEEEMSVDPEIIDILVLRYRVHTSF